MKKKLSQKDQIFISGSIIIGIIVLLCFMFIFQPMLKKIMDYTKEEENIKAQLRKASNLAADKEKLAAEVKNISKMIFFYEERLPKKTDIPQVLDELVKIGEKSEVTFISIEPQEIKRVHVGQSGQKNYIKIPIELILKAGYHEFALFVNGVENFPQFMRVDNVKINGDVSNTRKHDISLTVTAFALEDN
ncbi:MAG: type 4a pilus biogenesis protein PilO [Candidatus Omnitrophota bacterium]